jgi:hypothetical protein
VLLILATVVASRSARDQGSSGPAKAPAAAKAKPAAKASAKAAAAPSAKASSAASASSSARAPAKRATPAHAATRPSHPARQAPGSVRTTKVKLAPGKAPGAVAGLPVSLARAFAARKVVVLFFAGKGGDDALTADSVRRVRAASRRRVAVFMDKLSHLSDYRRVVEGLDVSQSPSIVLVGRDRRARLYEGYVDAESLRQYVADVAR